jgi:hypothetical protein
MRVSTSPVGIPFPQTRAFRNGKGKKEFQMTCYLVTATLAIGVLATTPQPPAWEASYAKALQSTRAAESPLLVVLDKPSSEDARLEPELLSEGAVSGEKTELLRPYRLCHVDVSTRYGKKVARAFGAKSFPHVAIIDKTGSSVIFRKSGKIQSKEWKGILTRHRLGERTSVSRMTYKPTGTDRSPASRPYCPNCQRNSF